MPRKIYVASSWRNEDYWLVVETLRASGHRVYDFKDPAPHDQGFAWEQVDKDWKNWTPAQYLAQIRGSERAREGFAFDKEALDWCDTCVLVMPSGRSAHIEAGYCAGKGKETFVLLSPDGFEPELMYLLCDGMTDSLEDLVKRLLPIEETPSRHALLVTLQNKIRDYLELHSGGVVDIRELIQDFDGARQLTELSNVDLQRFEERLGLLA